MDWSGDTRPYVDDTLIMLPGRVDAVLAARYWAMNDCEVTSALFRCEPSMASHADSGYCSKRPVSRDGSDGEAPRPALLMRIVAVPNRCPTSRSAASTAARSVTSSWWVET